MHSAKIILLCNILGEYTNNIPTFESSIGPKVSGSQQMDTPSQASLCVDWRSFSKKIENVKKTQDNVLLSKDSHVNMQYSKGK